MARLSFALPIFDRCERPRTASVRACRLQPGRLAQGPVEKCGTVGRVAGSGMAIAYPSRYSALGGEGCPAAGDKEERLRRQVQDGRRPLPPGVRLWARWAVRT